MRRRIRSDSEVKHKQIKPPLVAQSRSVNLHKEPKNYDMLLLVTDTSAENQGSGNCVPTNFNSMQPNKAPYSSDLTSAANVIETNGLAIKENSSSCEINSLGNGSPESPGSLPSSGRPTSMSSIASSRTSRGSDYFSSSSSADNHHEMKSHKSATDFELTSELGDAETATRTVLNRLVESVREEEEEEGFVDSENFASPNEKHFNNSSNREEKIINPPKLSKQRNGVTVKDINKKLREVDLLSPIATMAMVANPQLTYVDRIILELLETERMYVRALEDILAGYILPMRNTSLSVSPEDFEKLFLNIKDIYAFNRKFLSFLENCESDPVLIAEHFVSKDVSFNVYTEYCTNYPIAIGVLTRWMKSPAVADFFKSQQELLRHNLPLGSYLLKPVQRILKYHLILQELVKNCDEDIENYWIIEQALHTMTHIAHHINEMKRKHEDAVHVQEIQSLLTNWQGDDLTTYGDLVMEGDLKLQGAKNERMVFLFDKMILITKRREDGFLVCKITIMCSDLILLESIKENPLSFLISPFDSPSFHNHHSSRAAKQYTLTAKFVEDKKLWTQNIKRLIIKNHHAAIPLHAQQSIMNMDAVGLDDGMEHHQRKPRYSNTSIEDLKRPLKRFGTTVSVSSLGLSGKGPIRRRSDSGSRKSLQMRSFRKTHETELSDDVSSDSVPNTPNAANPGKGRFSFPRISYPVSPTLNEEAKKHMEYDQEKLEPGNVEVTEEDTMGDLSHRASEKEDKENSKKKNKKTNTKHRENYKKSVIYRRHKRRVSEPVTDEEMHKSAQFSAEEKAEKNKLDMSLEDFETAEDFLSFNIDNSRESVSWDVQIVEAAFEKFKRDQAEAAKLRAAAVDHPLLIPMPNRHRYSSSSESSDDEAPVSQHHEQTKPFQKQSDIDINADDAVDAPTEHTQSDINGDENPVSDVKVSKPGSRNHTQRNEDETSLYTTPAHNDNDVEIDPTVSSADETPQENNDSIFVDPSKSNNTLVAPKIKPTLSALSSLNERQKYFERLKEIRDRRHSQTNLGPDAKTIQTGLVKEMIDHHRENMASQVKSYGGFSPPVQKHNPLDRLSVNMETARVSRLRNELSRKDSPQQTQAEHECDKVNKIPATVKLQKHDRSENGPKYPTKGTDNTSAFSLSQLRKTNHRNMDLDTKDNQPSMDASAPLHFTSSSGSSVDNDEQHDTQNPAKLRFKNFLQPKMLLWREYSEEIGLHTGRSKNLRFEECSTNCTAGSLNNRQSNSARLSGKSKCMFKEQETVDQNLKTDTMSRQVDGVWNNLGKSEKKIIHSTSSSDSLLYNRRIQQKRNSSSKPVGEDSDTKVPPNLKASASISLRSNPTSPTISNKTKVRQIRLASSSETIADQPSELSKSSTKSAEPKHVKNNLHGKQDHSKASSVMKLAQQFDNAPITRSPIGSRPYGRSRSVGARKQLGEFRFSTPSETSTKSKNDNKVTEIRTKGPFQRRNSASDRWRKDKSQSPPRKASYTTPSNARIHRRNNERATLKSNWTSQTKIDVPKENSKIGLSRSSNEQNLQQNRLQKEGSEQAKPRIQKSNLTQLQGHKPEQTKLPEDKPKDMGLQAEKLRIERDEKVEPKEPKHHHVSANDFVSPLSIVSAFCATTTSQASDKRDTHTSEESTNEELSEPSRSKRESLLSKNDKVPSDFVAAFCKV